MHKSIQVITIALLCVLFYLLASRNRMGALRDPSSHRECQMAKRAAFADVQRNMLKTLEHIRIDADQTVESAMRSNKVA